jgi:hypothetical protein
LTIPPGGLPVDARMRSLGAAEPQQHDGTAPHVAPDGELCRSVSAVHREAGIAGGEAHRRASARELEEATPIGSRMARLLVAGPISERACDTS